MKRFTLTFLTTLIACSLAGLVPAAESTGGTEITVPDLSLDILTSSHYARHMLNWQEYVTGKPLGQLEMARSGVLKPNSLYISGAFWGTFLYEKTNTEGKFPILSRFPNQHEGDDGSRFILNNAAFALTGRLGDWLTLYLQPEYSEIEFSGQDELQLRKAYVMAGDLSQYPFYAYVGRNTVDFGDLSAYNPFTHTVNNHFFRVDSDDPVLGAGLSLAGFHLVGTLINGGRQLRTADTTNTGDVNNGAMNASFTFGLEPMTVRIGGGYLHSTIYNRDIAHHPGAGFAEADANSVEEVRNPAYDANIELGFGPLSFMAEWTRTDEEWPATMHKVQALTGQAAYDFSLLGKSHRLSLVYGEGEQGPPGTEYDDLKQIAIGFESWLSPFLNVGIEYVRNEAFVPLIDITEVSDGGVKTDTIILGAKAWF